MRNELTSSKETRIRPPMALPQNKSREEHQESIYTDARKAVRLNGIKARSTICGDQLGRSKQIKAKGRGTGAAGSGASAILQRCAQRLSFHLALPAGERDTLLVSRHLSFLVATVLAVPRSKKRLRWHRARHGSAAAVRRRYSAARS